MVALLVAGLVLMAACTNGDQSPSSTDPYPATTLPTETPTTTMPINQGVEAFRSCLAEQGVEIDVIPLDATDRPRLDLVVEGLDLTDPVLTESMAACSPALETGALDLSSEELLRILVVDQLSAFSQCARDMGVQSFPDPVPGFSGVGSPYAVAEIPYSDPLFKHAVEICRSRILAGLSGTE